MNEVSTQIIESFEYVRESLMDVNVNENVRTRMESIMEPIFTDPTSCARITEAINELGDFSENVLTPLLEQYVGAQTAAIVRFAIEDLLLFIEKYRDHFQKKAAASATVVPGIKNPRPSVKHTNAYRLALSPYNHKFNPKNNIRFRSNNTENSGELHRIRINEAGKIAAMLFDYDMGRIRETVSLPMPVVRKSGQVLVKVNAVGLSVYDVTRFNGTNRPLEQTGESRSNLATLRHNLSNSFASLRNTLRRASSVPQTLLARSRRGDLANITQDNIDSIQAKNVVGIEFAGVVKDIGWTKGDYIHMLPVAREQRVYGILTSATSNQCSEGALAEYLVCDVDNLIKTPKGVSDKDAASLPLEASAVCRALASVDVKDFARVLVIGAASNVGSILCQLLTKDLKVVLDDIFAIVGQSQVDVMKGRGFPNTISFSDFLDLHPKEVEDLLALIPNASLDNVFDCTAETDIAGRINFEKILKGKLKPITQYTKIDVNRLVAEKNVSAEGWQKEFNLVNKLLEERKLEFPSDLSLKRDIAFESDAVETALDSLRDNTAVGKQVVRISPQNVVSMKRRLADNSLASS